jgi:hypothetical protein
MSAKPKPKAIAAVPASSQGPKSNQTLVEKFATRQSNELVIAFAGPIGWEGVAQGHFESSNFG